MGWQGPEGRSAEMVADAARKRAAEDLAVTGRQVLRQLDDTLAFIDALRQQLKDVIERYEAAR